ncbi:uncharacterized protein [Oryza sativa Japonica Group]|uniref:uncharacterized protein n=1 Tax=Oryza sativa subsp. japonica TaxID=39947 RepID=UPI00339CD869
MAVASSTRQYGGPARPAAGGGGAWRSRQAEQRRLASSGRSPVAEGKATAGERQWAVASGWRKKAERQRAEPAEQSGGGDERALARGCRASGRPAERRADGGKQARGRRSGGRASGREPAAGPSLSLVAPLTSSRPAGLLPCPASPPSHRVACHRPPSHVRLHVRRWGHCRARLNQQPAATRPFSVAVRAGLKDTLFPDDPFRGSAGCRPRSARGGWRGTSCRRWTEVRGTPRQASDLCFVPPLVYAVMGSSRNLGVGPVATSSLLVASIVGGKVRASDDPRLYTQLVFVSALFTGVM